MYYDFFHLNGPAFSPAGAPARPFPGAGHREALAALQWGLREPSGFTMLVGEAGTGKTTLISTLLQGGGHDPRIALVNSPTLSFEEILRLLGAKLKFTARGGKLELITAFDSMMASLKPHESVALIFDEAQDLSGQALEELRLLSNPRWPEERRLQIVLVGQPELARRLEQPELRQLNQRIGARALLPPLRANEIAAYVEYRLRAQGGDLRTLFTRGALRELARRCGGIPRRINMLCHNALVLAFAQQARRVSRAHMREAARDYDRLLWGQGAGRGVGSRAAVIDTAAASAFGIAALALACWVGAGPPTAPRVAPLPQPDQPSNAASLHAEKLPVRAAEVSKTEPAAAAVSNSGGAPDSHQDGANRAAIATVVIAQSAQAPPAITAAGAAHPSEADARAPLIQTSDRTAGVESAVVVRPGDTLSKIVLRQSAATPPQLRRRLAALMRSNPEITNPDRIYPGQIVQLQEASTGGAEELPK